MKIGSLFSGAGGLDMAVEQVFGGRIVWHSEIDKAASKVLAHRWPDVPNLGSITEIDWAAVEPVDVLCGGFPCQDVSAAGKRAGIKDGTRSGLWSIFADAIEALRPPIVIIENVRGLLSAKAHRDMESDPADMGNGSDRPVLRAAGAVLGDLADLGYDAQWTTVAASSVGAPHRRERVFIVAADTECGGGAWSPQSGGDSAADREGRQTVLAGGCRSHTSDSPRNGRHQGRPESAGIVRGFDAYLLPTPVSRDGKDTHSSQGMAEKSKLTGIAHLLPTPASADGQRGQDFARANREGSGGDDLVTLAVKADRDSAWGKYAPAIHRWESLTRPAPAPTEPNKNGNPRLAAQFSEWMMGWPAGWVTDPAIGISRNDQLRIVGNGVCPQQATAALTWLLKVAEVAA